MTISHTVSTNTVDLHIIYKYSNKTKSKITHPLIRDRPHMSTLPLPHIHIYVYCIVFF